MFSTAILPLRLSALLSNDTFRDACDAAPRLCEVLSATIILRDDHVVPRAHVGPLLVPRNETRSRVR
jgi:hypothetical protein